MTEEQSHNIQEALAYLTTTGWIWEKYIRNVLFLKDMTEDAFKSKYEDIVLKQEEARKLLNEFS